MLKIKFFGRGDPQTTHCDQDFGVDVFLIP